MLPSNHTTMAEPANPPPTTTITPLALGDPVRPTNSAEKPQRRRKRRPGKQTAASQPSTGLSAQHQQHQQAQQQHGAAESGFQNSKAKKAKKAAEERAILLKQDEYTMVYALAFGFPDALFFNVQEGEVCVEWG